MLELLILIAATTLFCMLFTACLCWGFSGRFVKFLGKSYLNPSILVLIWVTIFVLMNYFFKAISAGQFTSDMYRFISLFVIYSIIIYLIDRLKSKKIITSSSSAILLGAVIAVLVNLIVQKMLGII